MKYLPLFLTALLALFASQPDAEARVVTVIVTDATPTKEIELSADETVELISTGLNAQNYVGVQVTKDGVTFGLSLSTSAPKQILAGPAHITVTKFVPGIQFCSFSITPDPFAPDRTIIALPGTNQTSITLECSTNLIHWVSATNGVYGPMPQAKFFRIKAQSAN